MAGGPEFVEGGPLEKFCKADALLEPREISEIVFKCVRALDMGRLIGMTDLAPVEDIYITNFKPVPTAV